MSVKAMSLVWDFKCPQEVNGLTFKPNHKYVLQAYADHADHHGKNIWPSVQTIAGKTGYEERNVQRLTRDLEAMGLMVPDGVGPRGTHKYSLPFNDGGDKLSPLANCQGDKDEKSLGDISLGDISLGDNLSPEFNEHNLSNNISIKYIDVWVRVINTLKEDYPRGQFGTWIEPAQLVGVEDQTLIIGSRNQYARDWLENHIAERAQEISGYFVKFVVADFEATELEEAQ